MSGTTNILELPSEIRENSNSKEIVNRNQMDTINVNQQQMSQGTGMGSPGINLDETTINQIVNGLQRASIAGATQLQSRDIPITTSNISNDEQVQPNYVPTQPLHKNSDYIKDYEETDDIINNYNKKNQKNNSMDDM